MRFDPTHVTVLRSRRGLNRQELAKLADVDPSYLTLIEQGKRRPTDATIDALAKALRCEREALFTTEAVA